MSELCGTKELLAQLDELKSAAQDYANREEKLASTFRDQAAREKKNFDVASLQLQSAANARVATAEEKFTAHKRQLESLFSLRQRRINRVHHGVREMTAEGIGAREEKCKSEATQGLIAAERRHDEELGQAKTNFENFQNVHAEAAGSFHELEKKVRSAFSGVGSFRRMLNVPVAAENHNGDGSGILEEAGRISASIESRLTDFKKHFAPMFFRFLPVWFWFLVLISTMGTAVAWQHWQFGKSFLSPLVFIVVAAILLLVALLYFLGTRSAAPKAKQIAENFVRAKQLVDSAPEQSSVWHQSEQQRIATEWENTKNFINSEWKREIKEIAQVRNSRPVELESRIAQLERRNGDFFQTRLQRHQSANESTLALLGDESARQQQALETAHKEKLTRLEAQLQNGWNELESGWRKDVLPLCEQIKSSGAAAEKEFPDWAALNAADWQPPKGFLNAAKFARLEIDTRKFFPALPKDQRLALPCPPQFFLPLLLKQPQQGSLLIETNKQGDSEAVAAMNNLILRLLATTPPGRVEFTIFDPVGLGQNFATLMHLADYEGGAINSRIWTQAAQFEEKLADLSEHMEKIIQMYLRNEYATIAEYNAQAGSVAEKYHVLVIASFPVNFTDTAAKRLRNIAASGARCGVFTFIHWDQRNAAPSDFVPDELRQNSVCLFRAESGFEIANWRAPGTKLVLDAPPSAEFATDFLHRVGDLGRNANRVEVPFESVAPADADMWTEETSQILRVPIGRSGATKFQLLEVGQGTRQHALIAGKTGSGKSTLFHVIITNLALRCSPEQVEFYLVDFKKGVEFKCYGSRKLPHARVVAIESDREFGLSVLQRVDDELRRRGDLFRKVGAQDLAGYKRSLRTATASQPAGEPMPRTLLMIDEFQEFFTEEDRISQGAAVLLDRIVRQGRAFGIHVILGSQTLGGAYTLARATIGQMVIRIALQCNEADAYLIMDQDNPAPRLLSRPGEGIYNDAAGMIEGNSPFQAVWLSDKTRDNYLEKIRARADESGDKYPGPIVFEGNAPADVRENLLLNSALKHSPTEIPSQSRIWLGAPNSIKGPTEAVFQKQSGSHLLVVGQSEERTGTILSVGLVALAAQYPHEAARFYVFDATPPGFPQRELLERVAKSVKQTVIQVNNANVAEIMGTLAEELKSRSENDAQAPDIFVLIQGLQNFKKLKQEDEFSFSSSNDAPNPAAIFASLITEGPARGIHLIAACDTYNNVFRFIGRKALTEFEMRVVFQMSASDSASLIDAPNASTLGLNRAVLFNERESLLETFRPYSPPGGDWLDEIASKLESKL